MGRTSKKPGAYKLFFAMMVVLVIISKNPGILDSLAVFANDNAPNGVGVYKSAFNPVTTVEDLDKILPGQKIGSVYSVSKSEYIHLCNLVYREAGNGQIDEWEAALVVETVMNRCANKNFPAKVSDVIHQKGQFVGILSTRVYGENVNDYVKEAVLSYLNGDYPNHGMLFYWGDSKHNYFFKTEEAHAWTYYTEYQKWGVYPDSIVNYC